LLHGVGFQIALTEMSLLLPEGELPDAKELHIARKLLVFTQ
jgi:hypothetical protein